MDQKARVPPVSRLHGTIAKLTRRTKQLAVANSKLRREISRRSSVEKSLRSSTAEGARLLARSQRMQQELRLLSRRLLSVQEEERKRISRDLHDVVAQALSGINLRLALLTRQSTAGAKDLHRRIAATQHMVQQSVNIVHRFARDLRPAVLDDLGLVPALRSHLTAGGGLKTVFSSTPAVESLGLMDKTVLYRVFQEALTNIVQHARATKVTIRLTFRAGQVHMMIGDDGRGFSTEKVLHAKTGAHLGLLGMKERVEMIGGTFSLESTPRRSTTIRVALPLKPARRRLSPRSPRSEKGGS